MIKRILIDCSSLITIIIDNDYVLSDIKITIWSNFYNVNSTKMVKTYDEVPIFGLYPSYLI